MSLDTGMGGDYTSRSRTVGVPTTSEQQSDELESRSERTSLSGRNVSMIKKQFVKSRGVTKLTFELPADLEADAVSLLADFNDWNPVPFSQLKSGKWKLVQEVEPGRGYEFRYKVIHGDHEHYFNDPDADGVNANDQGTENAVVQA